MGHALNKVLKDIIVRYKSMIGYHAPYVPGWDTHGLPIEKQLTKKGVKRKEMTVAEFRKLCAEYAMNKLIVNVNNLNDLVFVVIGIIHILRLTQDI